jgi:hypothetical protein
MKHYKEILQYVFPSWKESYGCLAFSYAGVEQLQSAHLQFVQRQGLSHNC